MSVRTRFRFPGYAVVALAVALTACAGDDTASTTGLPDATTASTSTTPTPSTTTPTTSVAETTVPSTVATTPVEPHPLDLTSEEICAIVSPEAVAAVLGVTLDEAVAIADATPQCSYQFRRDDGQVNNVVVNVPAVETDLEGRTGTEAYDYVVGLTRDPAYTETVLDIGDGGIMFSSPDDAEAGVDVSVLRVGERVIITIATVGVFDVDTLNDLNELTAEALAP